MKTRNQLNFTNTLYVPIQKHWRRLRPIFQSPEAAAIWKPCLVEYAQQCAIDNGHTYEVKAWHTSPSGYDGCDWRFGQTRRGPDPAYWEYVCMRACHWIVDLSLFVARCGFASEDWRIVSSQKHSTVWNGNYDVPLLFDLNFLAIGTTASDALKLASTGRELKVGQYLKAYLHRKE